MQRTRTIWAQRVKTLQEIIAFTDKRKSLSYSDSEGTLE